MFVDWNPQAYEWLIERNYSQIATLYEQAIEICPQITQNYGYLGLAYLLLGQEEIAQSVWLTPSLDADETQLVIWNQELRQILAQEALRQEAINANSIAWVIRRYLHELSPGDLDNFVRLIQHSCNLGQFSESLVENFVDIIDKLNKQSERVDSNLLISTANSLTSIDSSCPTILDLIIFCLQKASEHTNVLELVTQWVEQALSQSKNPLLVIEIAQTYANAFPNYQPLLYALTNFFTIAEDHVKAIEYSLKFEMLCQLPEEKVLGSYLVLRARMGYGVHDQDLKKKVSNHQELLDQFITYPPLEGDRKIAQMIATTTYFSPYLEDCPQRYRQLQNQIGTWCCQLWQDTIPENKHNQLLSSLSRQNTQTKIKDKKSKIRVGYLSHSLKQHSVGWLCRWLFQYYQRDNFHVSLFLTSDSTSNFTQSWFIQQVDTAYNLQGATVEVICNCIQDNQIDILVDLDSLTSDINLGVLAAKPAPIQISWLGWDAPGLPTVDYFLADPYVLPDNAESYYCEKIWRLPHTYIAVDGFEIGVPTLRREHLGIPNDAIVYFSGQRGYKRHPEIMQLQMSVIREVPNSYLLIKGVAEQASTQAYFRELAEIEGINPERLCFLPQVGRELEHRANLQIADVVLDTFPYNGATTTLETLWLGIPIVTLVGHQFAARNSYAFMKNAGIEAGIGWTTQEYLDWGIAFGKDPELRMSVHQTLQATRHTAPLWNTRKFVAELEQAYQTIWINHG